MRATLLTLLGLFAVGSADAQVNSRDSAGVRIVENRTPLWAKTQAWTVASKPFVDIGVVEDDPAYELSGVMGVTRLSDGRVVVANMQTNEVRFYDAKGKHIRSVGRKGEGPGEFRQVMGLRRLRGDTLMVHDSHDQAEIIAENGKWVRGFAVSGSGRGTAIVAAFEDGSFLTGDSPQTGRARGPAGAQWTDSSTLDLHDPDTKKRASMGKVVAVRMANLPQRTTYVEFSPRMTLATHGRKLAIGFGDRFSISVHDNRGRKVMIVRRAWEPVHVTRADLDAYHDKFVGAADESGKKSTAFSEFREKRFKEAVFAETFPAYDRIRYDGAGNLWAREHRRPREMPMNGCFSDTSPFPQKWSVFDPSGRWLGEVNTPASLEVFEIGADYVAGLFRDDLDAEQVRLYQLNKPAR